MAKVHVFHPPAGRPELKCLDWTSQDQQPYIIELETEDGRCRVHRHFQSILELTQTLEEMLPGQVPVLPVARSFFGRFRFGAYADSDAGEQRRSEVASHLNGLYRLCANSENQEPFAHLIDFLTPRRVFRAIEDGDMEEIQSLLKSQTQTVWDSEEKDHFSPLHYVGHCARQGKEKIKAIGDVLLEFGADVHQLDKQFRSPLMFAVSGDNKELGEDWENFVLTLIECGSDLQELSPEGDTLLHRCVHHKTILESITARIDRIKDYFNAEKKSPYTLATEEAEESIQNFFRSIGARKEKDFTVIQTAMEEQTKQFDAFLEESHNRGDKRETIQILIRLADLQLLDRPMATAKILNCALYLSNDIQMEREEIYEKLFQVYCRLAFIYQRDISLPGETVHMDLLRKRRTKAQEIRSNLEYVLSHKKTDQAFKWITDQFNIVVKNAVNDTLSLMGSPPCPYAFLGLGPFSRYQCSPSTRIQFALLISDPSNDVLEYFRLFVQIFELTVINLQETPFKVLNFGTVSPIAAGLRLDYHGNIPYSLALHGPFSFVGTPLQLAQLQEPEFFKENANAGTILWEAGFIMGEKKVFDSYRLEVDRILHRKEGTQTRTLRQKRAVAMIRTDVQAFVPSLNRDIAAEARFELHKYLVGFPMRAITWLCWYYKIDALGITMWDRIDRLCSAGVLSKEGCKNFKMALSNIMELYVRTGEKKIVDIGTAISEYNTQNPPYDSDEEESPVTPRDNEMEIQNDFESFEMEGGDIVPAKKKDEVFVLHSSDVEQIAQAYLVLLPLHQALKEWLIDENKNQEKASLKGSDLFNGSNSTLAEAYLRLCHYEKAKYYFRSAIEQDPENFTVLNSFGVMWNKLGNYKKAIKYYEKAGDVIAKEKGENAPQLATLYSNIAMANVNLEQNLEAIQWLEKALRVDESVYGEKHRYVARDYRNIGLMALKELQFEKSLDYLRRGLAIDVEHCGDVSPEVAAYYNDIGRVYQGMEKYENALEHFEKALQVDKQLYSEANAIIASRYLNMAGILRIQKNYKQSLLLHEKALDIYIEVHGDDHLTVATTLYTCGVLAADMDQLEKALEYLKRSYNSFKKIKGKDDSETEVAYKKMKEIEDLLKRRQLGGEDYLKWKQAMEENRQKSENLASGLMEMEGGEKIESDEIEYVAPKVYGPDSVQQCKIDVFEDDFYEL